MRSELLRYVTKLSAEGIAAPGRCALLAADDLIQGAGAADLQAWGAPLLERLGVTALAVVEPSVPFVSFLLARLPLETERIVPRDTETRTFLHDIPVLRQSGSALDLDHVVRLLGQRRGLLVEGIGIVASGAFTIEQAYVNASSLFHALYVKYLLDALTGGLRGAEETAAFAAFRRTALREPDAEGLSFRTGPLLEPAEILDEMCRVGRYTVERKLVDSFFGNISCRLGEELYISQTASSLDALEGCIDPIPFALTSTLGLTASSELPAHRRIFELTDARTILHGHPRFAVALSMLCDQQGRCDVTDCWRDCPQVRLLGNVPVVAGEVGAGGLAKRVPPVIGAPGRTIVYGHGVFAIGRDGFEEPFRALVETERWCRQEYFRRFDARTPFG